jgi:hypothetical protein
MYTPHKGRNQTTSLNSRNVYVIVQFTDKNMFILLPLQKHKFNQKLFSTGVFWKQRRHAYVDSVAFPLFYVGGSNYTSSCPLVR